MKVKISALFDAYESQSAATPNVELVFSKSGMVNSFRQLERGFFPLGSGILSGKSKIDEAEIEEGEIMILGNDFGTVNYVKDKCKNKSEDNSRTIKNLEHIGLESDKIFFTNFFLGLRDDDNHRGTTMTNLVVDRKPDYKDFCLKFFVTQLTITNPRVVICIGKEVGFILNEYFKDEFSVFSNKSITYSKLYKGEGKAIYDVPINNPSLGERRFLFIPHPSWAHINWKNHDIESKIKIAIQS